MGVIKERRPVESVHPNNDIQEGNLVSANSQESLALAPPVDSLPPAPTAYRRFRHRSTLHKMPTDDTIPVPRGSKIGAKKLRRYENICELVSMCADEDFGELTIQDFMPNSGSVFTRLLENTNLMQIWNDFISSSEEKQDFILKGRAADDEKLCSTGTKASHVQCDNPKTAFYNIDRDLRNKLKQRGLPLGLVQSLEEEVIDFFTATPSSVYISQVLPGFQRLLVHALCQYNTLISQSFGTEGQRQVRVDNPNENFRPPTCSLARYLEDKKRLQRHN